MKGREQVSKAPKALKIILYAVVLALVLAGCGASGGDTVERFAEAASSDGGSIAIPGYETLSFTAGNTAQTVRPTNPPENACTFVLSLTLDESGETLWTGEALSPGEAFTRITLSKALDAGSYPATLKYDCYTLEDKTPLNGAEIKVTIQVN